MFGRNALTSRSTVRPFRPARRPTPAHRPGDVRGPDRLTPGGLIRPGGPVRGGLRRALQGGTVGTAAGTEGSSGVATRSAFNLRGWAGRPVGGGRSPTTRRRRVAAGQGRWARRPRREKRGCALPGGTRRRQVRPAVRNEERTLGTSAPWAPYRRLRGVHRFLREAVSDAVKHAAPSRIVIKLAVGGRSLTPTITDGGQGRCPATPTAAPRPARVGVAAATAGSHGVAWPRCGSAPSCLRHVCRITLWAVAAGAPTRCAPSCHLSPEPTTRSVGPTTQRLEPDLRPTSPSTRRLVGPVA